MGGVIRHRLQTYLPGGAHANARPPEPSPRCQSSGGSAAHRGPARGRGGKVARETWSSPWNGLRRSENVRDCGPGAFLDRWTRSKRTPNRIRAMLHVKPEVRGQIASCSTLATALELGARRMTAGPGLSTVARRHSIPWSGTPSSPAPSRVFAPRVQRGGGLG